MRPHPQGREAGRSTRAANQIRIAHQSQDRQGAWARLPQTIPLRAWRGKRM